MLVLTVERQRDDVQAVGCRRIVALVGNTRAVDGGRAVRVGPAGGVGRAVVDAVLAVLGRRHEAGDAGAGVGRVCWVRVEETSTC